VDEGGRSDTEQVTADVEEARMAAVAESGETGDEGVEEVAVARGGVGSALR
jgi:hypothetical protein